MSLFSWGGSVESPLREGLYPNPRHPRVCGMLSGGITIWIHEPCRSRTQCCTILLEAVNFLLSWP